jgi:hypothetical protein
MPWHRDISLQHGFSCSVVPELPVVRGVEYLLDVAYWRF